ncbi:hypothetical protein Ancab_000662 [Ancistrocladus abbreviatus]
MPLLATAYTGTASVMAATGYITYINFMNNMGHCIFEFVPKWVFSIFPPLKYLMYTSPLASKWYLWAMWPTTAWLMILTRVYGRTFIVERNTFKQLKSQSCSASLQHKWLICCCFLLNQPEQPQQGEELNRNGEFYVEKHPKLRVKLVDGSSLVAAVVLNSIPKGTAQVLLRGKLSKVAYSIVLSLCQKDIQVAALRMDEYEKLKIALAPDYRSNLIHSKSCTQKFSPKKIREDCFYLNPPSMVAPKSFENLHSCEVSSLKHSAPLFCIDVNWLPRRVMSAWCIAGILHALEGWNVNECGDGIFDVDKVWQAALEHGFLPLSTPLQL